MLRILSLSVIAGLLVLTAFSVSAQPTFTKEVVSHGPAGVNVNEPFVAVSPAGELATSWNLITLPETQLGYAVSFDSALSWIEDEPGGVPDANGGNEVDPSVTAVNNNFLIAGFDDGTAPPNRTTGRLQARWLYSRQ